MFLTALSESSITTLTKRNKLSLFENIEIILVGLYPNWLRNLPHKKLYLGSSPRGPTNLNYKLKWQGARVA